MSDKTTVSTIIRNQEFKVNELKEVFKNSNKVQGLVNEYKKNPNCHPHIWLSKNDGLTEIEEISFIYHCVNN